MRRVGPLLPRGLLCLMLCGLLVACGDATERYCAEVEDQQEALSGAVAEGGPGALLDVLPNLQELRERAPDDLRDEWDTVVTRLQRLDDALAEAGIEPDDFVAEGGADGSGGGTDLGDDERTAIEAAARELATPEMLQALEGVQQQALDVCGTALTR